jgi:hypothetical protein
MLVIYKLDQVLIWYVTYNARSASSTCSSCPDYSTSSAGSSTCQCNPGYIQTGIYDSLTCSICPAGTYSGFGTNCVPCSANFML